MSKELFFFKVALIAGERQVDAIYPTHADISNVASLLVDLLAGQSTIYYSFTIIATEKGTK